MAEFAPYVCCCDGLATQVVCARGNRDTDGGVLREHLMLS
jgi:hypothetical protein